MKVDTVDTKLWFAPVIRSLGRIALSVSTRHLASSFRRCHRAVVMLGLLLVLFGQSGCTYARPAMKVVLATRSTCSLACANVGAEHGGRGKRGRADRRRECGNQKRSTCGSRLRTIHGRRGSRSPIAILTRQLAFAPERIRGRREKSRPGPSRLDTLDPKSHGLQNSDRKQSPLDRLDAALSDDVQQAQALPQQSLTVIEQRYRVELLVTRAKALLALGAVRSGTGDRRTGAAVERIRAA